MTKQYLQPLALAVGVALSLTACGKQDSNPASPPASSASAAPATTSTTAAADLGKSIFDVSELDPTLNACQDFNGFVNAKWVAANPIPADRTRWGAFDQLAEDSLNTQHAIVEAAAKDAAQAQAGSIEQKIGYLYQSGMDEAAIDKAGFDPIKPKLDAIAGLKNGADVADYITRSYVDGDRPGVPVRLQRRLPARRHADRVRVRMRPGPADQGLLQRRRSTRTFATRTVAYIAKALELTGVADGRRARQQAADVLAFETRLAAASLAPVELRDPKNQYHFVTRQASRQGHADISTGQKFFAAQGVTIDKGFSLSQPKFFAEVRQAAGQGAGRQWQAYLRFHTIDDASPYLSKPFAGQQVRVLRQDPVRPAGTAGALEARAGRRQRVHGPGARPAVRGRGVPARSQGARAGAGRQRAQCAEGAHREPRLDERRDQGQGDRQVGHVPAEDRLSGQVARLVRPERSPPTTTTPTSMAAQRSSTTTTTSPRSASRPTARSGA